MANLAMSEAVLAWTRANLSPAGNANLAFDGRDLAVADWSFERYGGADGMYNQGNKWMRDGHGYYESAMASLMGAVVLGDAETRCSALKNAAFCARELERYRAAMEFYAHSYAIDRRASTAAFVLLAGAMGGREMHREFAFEFLGVLPRGVQVEMRACITGDWAESPPSGMTGQHATLMVSWL